MKLYKTTTVTLKRPAVPLEATIYKKGDGSVSYQGVLLYFHGGGLIFGHRHDLPDTHILTFLNKGYAVISFDYRLGPASEISEIMEDVCFSVDWYLKNQTQLFGRILPYYLFGRSAGAYLCLLAGKKEFDQSPAGILSYYGYTFLEEGWYKYPAPHYQKLGEALDGLDTKAMYHTAQREICTQAPPKQRYALYADARRSGTWLSCFHKGREKDFYLNYTFRGQTDFSQYPPVFLAHSLRDTDVPYMESKRLTSLLPKTQLHTAGGSVHEFDEQQGFAAKEVLEKSCAFLERCTGVRPF